MTNEAPKVYEVIIEGPQGAAWIIGDVASWDADSSYSLGNLVFWRGSTFRARHAVEPGIEPSYSNNLPVNSDDWEVIAAVRLPETYGDLDLTNHPNLTLMLVIGVI